MAGRQTTTGQANNSAALAASLMLVAWIATPTVAAPNLEVRCDSVVTVSLDIPDHKLKAEIEDRDVGAKSTENSRAENKKDSLSRAEYLVPRAEAAARRVFKDAAAPLAETKPAADEQAASESAESETLPGMNTRVPGVSASDLARYRRQMYRTDI